MCGRFTLAASLKVLQIRFDFEATELTHSPRYNIAPTQPALTVIGGDNEEKNRAGFMRWGLIPSWAKDASIGNRMINARAETLAEKPSFRNALQKRRCLVLADGFYEWQAEGRKKTPVYVYLKSHEPFAMAGLWETWRDPAGEAVHSYTIVTTNANALLEPIHPRMPVILSADAESIWLNREITDTGLLTAILAPHESENMEAYPVSPLVNSVANDSPECVTPAGTLL